MIHCYSEDSIVGLVGALMGGRGSAVRFINGSRPDYDYYYCYYLSDVVCRGIVVGSFGGLEKE